VRFRAPGEQEAQERAWQIVGAAFAEREPVAWPRRHVRPLVAGALVAAVVAAVLSPPGRSVVHSLRKAVGVQQAEPALFSLPTPGQLLVTSRTGAWLVHQDGSKRLLGHYRDAAFSPHGRFIAATRANQLVALDPKGNVRWTLARPSPRFPAWTGTSTDTRIAYLSGGRLRIVAGDGTGDRAIAHATHVAPAWRAGPGRVLAFATAPKSVVVMSTDDGRIIRRLQSPEPVQKLLWSTGESSGDLLLVFTPHATRVYDRNGRVAEQDDPSDATFDRDAAFIATTPEVAAIRAAGLGSSVFSLASGRTFFNGSGVLSQLASSPDGRWLLLAWPTANQWVFVRLHPRKIVGVSRVTQQFGRSATIQGWCCAG